MNKSALRLVMLIAAAFVTTTALAAQRSYDRRLSAPPGGQLTFRSDVGSVKIVGHQAPEVLIHAQLQGSESFLARVHIRTEQTPSGVRISVHAAPRGGWFHWFEFSSHRVRFALEVPRDYPVHVRTSGGSVEVQDLNASVRVATSGGSAVVQNISGAVHVHTAGGSTQAVHLNGPATFSTAGGSIEVTDSTGDLDLSTAGGGIRLKNDDGRVHAATSGGSIRAQLQANHGIRFRTAGGDITLLLPQNTHASVDAEASGGSITSDFPMSTVRFAAGEHLRGTIGGGGERISLHSAGGDIHIARVQ